jgi:hypothetical protein
MHDRIERIPSPLPGIEPGDWVETSRPPRQVERVGRYRVRFTDGTEALKAAPRG